MSFKTFKKRNKDGVSYANRILEVCDSVRSIHIPRITCRSLADDGMSSFSAKYHSDMKNSFPYNISI